MKPYGVKRKDRGCCPGHDKYPEDTYKSRRSKRARARGKKLSHSAARAEEAQILTVEQQSSAEGDGNE